MKMVLCQSMVRACRLAVRGSGRAFLVKSHAPVAAVASRSFSLQTVCHAGKENAGKSVKTWD